ncbi:MAG: sensor histidine kinase, partial [Alphaproteobacteria bacterium]|nr:sensor histidine kinase [Alphaproteobacteria bacterium]
MSMASADPSQVTEDRQPTSWRVRGLFAVFVAIAVSIVWFTNDLLTRRFTETTRSRAEVRLALYSGNLQSELQRNSVVPLLLSRDPALIGALNSGDFSQSTQRLISYRDEIGAAKITLFDGDGRAVAATERIEIGENNRATPYFVGALRSSETVFTTSRRESGLLEFTYSRKIEISGDVIGVIAVGVNLRKFEASWAGFSDAVMVLNSDGEIILSTEARWRGLTEEGALETRSAPNAIQRAIRA